MLRVVRSKRRMIPRKKVLITLTCKVQIDDEGDDSLHDQDEKTEYKYSCFQRDEHWSGEQC